MSNALDAYTYAMPAKQSAQQQVLASSLFRQVSCALSGVGPLGITGTSGPVSVYPGAVGVATQNKLLLLTEEEELP